VLDVLNAFRPFPLLAIVEVWATLIRALQWRRVGNKHKHFRNESMYIVDCTEDVTVCAKVKAQTWWSQLEGTSRRLIGPKWEFFKQLKFPSLYH
jgi:hypothetical protein